MIEILKLDDAAIFEIKNAGELDWISGSATQPTPSGFNHDCENMSCFNGSCVYLPIPQPILGVNVTCGGGNGVCGGY